MPLEWETLAVHVSPHDVFFGCIDLFKYFNSRCYRISHKSNSQTSSSYDLYNKCSALFYRIYCLWAGRLVKPLSWTCSHQKLSRNYNPGHQCFYLVYETAKYRFGLIYQNLIKMKRIKRKFKFLFFCNKQKTINFIKEMCSENILIHWLYTEYC